MRSHWTFLVLPALCLAPLCWSADKVGDKSAEDKAADAFYANRMVISALEAEVKGDFAARERLLNEAAQSGAARAAQAHLGMIDVGGKKPEWKTIDESIAEANKDAKLALYEKVRAQTPDTADGHLQSAQWCLSRKMEDQARAHLSRVLDFSPDHAVAREALGFVRMGDKWISLEEIERMQANAAAKTNSIQKHGKTIAALIEKMKSKTPKERESATAAFLALKDATAVGAVETALNTPDVPTSKLLIEWMAQVDCVESSLVLTRYSLLHPDDGMRTLAMEKLVTRPLHDFVPEMLKMLSSPITMMVQPNYDNRGRFSGYRQAFGREGMGEKDFQIVASNVQRVAASPLRLNSRGGLRSMDRAAMQAADAEIDAQVRQQAEFEVKMRQLEMERQNALIKQVNERIAAVVAKVSGKPLTEKAEEMWQWWDEYNETEYQKYKPERYKQDYFCYSVPRYSCECFMAGTPVLTQHGPRAIETVVPGDLVLNRDLQTGALRWQPVLKATMRPPANCLDVTVGNDSTDTETLRCTVGHLFWVSGAGWKKASELKAGDILHGAKAPIRVTAVEARPPVQTYNLQIADAPNYFVGRNMILTHDVTPRETNRQTFPGQDLVRHLSEQRPVRKTASN